MTDLKLGNFELKKPAATSKRLAMILWGSSGAGKTTFAATAPGKKLWIMFDPDGDISIANRDDVEVADLSGESSAVINRMRIENPLQLEQLLSNGDFDTVVFDSVTSYAELALEAAVKDTKGATIEFPTLQGYGKRNTYVVQTIHNLLRLTAKLNKHMIFICHEDVPSKDELTGRVTVSLLLGGKLPEQVPIRLSECWLMESAGDKREVTLVSSRTKKPMKSRMFKTAGTDGKFQWKFDPDTLEGEGIGTWYEQWEANSFNKIPLPA